MKSETFQRINELTDAQQARLEEIIREHLRLAKEHMQPGTSCKRKKEIFSRIESKGLVSRSYLSVKNTSEERIFVNRNTGAVERFKKEGDDYLHTLNGRSRGNLQTEL